MIQQVLSIMNAAVSAVATWFGQVMDRTGAGSLYIAIMSVVLSVGLLLQPLLGSTRSGLSDMNRSLYKKGKDE